MQIQKTCSKCHLTKPLSQYTKDKHGKYGVRGECKDCKRIADKKYVESKKGKVNTESIPKVDYVASNVSPGIHQESTNNKPILSKNEPSTYQVKTDNKPSINQIYTNTIQGQAYTKPSIDQVNTYVKPTVQQAHTKTNLTKQQEYNKGILSIDQVCTFIQNLNDKIMLHKIQSILSRKNNPVDLQSVNLVKELRQKGYSLSQIVKQTKKSKATILKYLKL